MINLSHVLYINAIRSIVHNMRRLYMHLESRFWININMIYGIGLIEMLFQMNIIFSFGTTQIWVICGAIKRVLSVKLVIHKVKQIR